MAEEKIIEEDSEEVIEEDTGKKVIEEDSEAVIEEDTGKKVIDIHDLPGVGAATAEKLMESGYDSLMAIAVATPGELMSTAGVTELASRKMIKAARDKLDMGFLSGADILKKREGIYKITSGCASFDTLLGGGFESGAITEAYGAYGVGKSQIAHILAVTTQLPRDKGGADAASVFIDTEGTFRPERIIELANGAGVDPDKALKNVHVARAYNSDHQMLLAERVEELIKKGVNVKLVVVDSLTAHFRAEFIGRGSLAERQQKLNKHMHVLARLADIHNLAVYVTNQVMSKPDMFFGDPTEAIGGHIVAHNSVFRIYLRRGKKGCRVAKLIDSPSLPDGETTFFVETAGLKDMN